MQTSTLVQASANVIRIVNLKKGDIFKYTEGGSYASIYYCIVNDLLNDGKNTAIECFIYKQSYGEIECSYKIFDGSKDIAIFPATLGELDMYFGNTIDAINNKIKDKKEEIEKLEKGLSKAIEFISGERTKKLTEVNYITMTQEEYKNEKKEEEKKALLEKIDNM